jgi:hypothetical protein
MELVIPDFTFSFTCCINESLSRDRFMTLLNPRRQNRVSTFRTKLLTGGLCRRRSICRCELLHEDLGCIADVSGNPYCPHHQDEMTSQLLYRYLMAEVHMSVRNGPFYCSISKQWEVRQINRKLILCGGRGVGVGGGE